MTVQECRQLVWDYYHGHGRDLPWRKPEPDGSFAAYKILVSEIMLQQTQASRVIPKYQAFLQAFPTVQALANASLSAVLAQWSGLGYNRRAKYLHEAAKQLAHSPQPWTIEVLTACKGIGYNTAAAVMTYSYNQPVAFIETNIRTVFIHHFFSDADKVPDTDILPLVKKVLDVENPREFFWALMDYGVHVKATAGNASRSSKHYAKQSKFEGSKRQIRGAVLRQLGQVDATLQELTAVVSDPRLEEVLAELVHEGLITNTKGRFYLG